MSGRQPLRVVHTSDVHLGAYAGEERWRDRRDLMGAAFRRVIDTANERNADLLIIAGDFFDNDRVDEETVEFAAREIARAECPVVICPGNHDPMDPGRLYWRYDLEAMAPNLRIVREHGGELFEMPGVEAVLWGRAYLDSDWHFRPLAGLPRRQDDRWHIALAHGHFVRASDDQNRSLLIREEEVMAAAGAWDYLALGHWEPHADVSCGGMTAVYSGAPMPLSDANRRAGWTMVVDFDDDGVRWQRVRVDPRGEGEQ